jgi:hypothetical protein
VLRKLMLIVTVVLYANAHANLLKICSRITKLTPPKLLGMYIGFAEKSYFAPELKFYVI